MRSHRRWFNKLVIGNRCAQLNYELLGAESPLFTYVCKNRVTKVNFEEIYIQQLQQHTILFTQS